MDQYTISLVRESFDLVEPIAPQAAAMFYDNLFALDPSLQRFFKGDLLDEGEKLMRMTAFAVRKLDEPQALIPTLEALARQHGEGAVRDESYEAVGSALLSTLQQGIGVAFTPEVREAWIDVYGTLASTVKAAARVPA